MHHRLTSTSIFRNDPVFRMCGILVIDMELRDLRYFATVAEHLHIGRAADSLDLSPTALGKSLRRLEKSVGAKLVQRASKGVALTAVGTGLLARIAPLHGMLIDVRREAADLAGGHSGHISIGANEGISESVVTEACIALATETKRIALRVTVMTDAELGNAVRKGEMDLCVSIDNDFSPAEFAFERLYVAEDIVFASANHPLAKRRRVTIQELAREHWAAINDTHNPQWRALIQAFEVNRLPPPTIALRSNSHSVRLSAVAYAGYVSIITRPLLAQEARRHPVVELPVNEMTLGRSLSIIYRKGAYLSPSAQRLIQIVKTQAKNASVARRSSK